MSCWLAEIASRDGACGRRRGCCFVRRAFGVMLNLGLCRADHGAEQGVGTWEGMGITSRYAIAIAPAEGVRDTHG